MVERRQLVAYVLSSAFVLALVVLALLRVGSAGRPAGGAAGQAASTETLRVEPDRDHPGRYRTAFEAMGTDVNLQVAAPGVEAARTMFVAARSRIDEVNRLMSTYLPDTEVSRLNRRGVGEVGEETLTVLRKALEVSRLSGGAFDATYAPLRTLWRKAAAEDKLPTSEQIAAARAATGYAKLRVSGREVRFAAPGMELDLGGIAKGYAIDQAAKALQDKGAMAGIVDIGHDLRLFGRPSPGKDWRVEVYSPPGMSREIVLDLAPCGVATSGDYARGYRVAGKWYSHIIDPRTGWPVERMPSVTVVAEDAITADGLATAVSVLGWPKGMELVESLPHAECLMMVRKADGTVEEHESGGLARLLEQH